MDKQSKDSECVQVFVRVRPEDTESPNGEFAVTIFEGNKSLRLSPPDGTYNSRKSVTAVDDKTFTFDHVFDEHCSQEQVYAKVAQHAKAVIGGYNTTIFAYGSTGSGKSHTMTGTSAQPGIIPRVVSEIFSIIEKTTALENDTLFYVRISYVELYNNNFRNLLEVASKELGFLDKEEQKGKANRRSSTGSMNEGQREEFNAATSRNNHHHAASNSQKIEVRESQSAGVFLSGHNLRIPITSAQEAFQLISKGNKLRHTGSTNCNDVSSRSHAILTIHVESRVSRLSSSSSSVNTLNTSMNRSYENLTTLTDDVTIGSPASSMCTSSELRLGKMHLVDLAGSERLAMSGAEGEALVETQNINLSLTALGDVLSALSRNATVHQQARANSNGNTHHSVKQMRNSLNSSVSGLQPLVPVPYRNSKLTHLLKDSLGGNSKTIMITNIRSLSVYYQQTYISLLYASRAKKIQNRTVVNRNVIGDTGIHAVTGEIERLKHRLDERTLEFDRLRLLHQKEHSENSSLKAKLMELSNANNSEKIQLENQLSQVSFVYIYYVYYSYYVDCRCFHL